MGIRLIIRESWIQVRAQGCVSSKLYGGVIKKIRGLLLWGAADGPATYILNLHSYRPRLCCFFFFWGGGGEVSGRYRPLFWGVDILEVYINHLILPGPGGEYIESVSLWLNKFLSNSSLPSSFFVCSDCERLRKPRKLHIPLHIFKSFDGCRQCICSFLQKLVI